MTDLGVAYVQIVPSMRGFKPAVQKAISGAIPTNAISNKIGGSLVNGFKSIGAVAATGFAAATAAVASFIPEAINASDATDKFKSTLEFAGLGSSQIDSLTKSARAYADSTVYSLSDIQTITAQLAANGVKDFDKLAQAAGNLNSVAGGSAETYSRVGLVLTQTAGAGKLTTENWNQLADALPGASGKIQTALADAGAYTGNFRDAMAAGEISADEFNAALLDLGFDETAVKMAASTSTIEGAVGNLKATIVGGLGDAISGLKPMITTGIGALAEALVPVFDKVAGVATRFGEVFSAGGFSGVLTSIQGALPVIGALGGSLTGLLSRLPMIGGAFTGLTGPIGIAIGLFAGLVASSPALQASLGGLLATLGGAFATLMPVLQNLAGAIMPVISQVVAALIPVLSSVIGTIGSLVVALTPLVATIGTFLAGAIERLLPLVMTVFNGIAGTIQTAIGVVQSIISTVMAVITGNWSGAWNGIKNIVSGVFNLIKGIFSTQFNVIKSVVSNGLSAVKSFFSNGMNALKSVATSAWGKLKSAFSTGISGAVNLVKSLPSKVLSALGNLGSYLKNSGAALINGFKDGITGAFNKVKDAVSGGLAKIRSFFPFSPAKEGPFSGKGWVLYSGLSIGEAMATGIKRSTPAVIDQANALASLTSSSLSGIGGQGLVFGSDATIGSASTWPSMPRSLTLRVGEREFTAYVDERVGVNPAVAKMNGFVANNARYRAVNGVR